MVLFYIIKEVFYKNFFFFQLYIKMSESNNLTYYQRNREIILNRAKDYYKNDKERLKEQARDKQIYQKRYTKKKYQEAKMSKHTFLIMI